MAERPDRSAIIDPIDIPTSSPPAFVDHLSAHTRRIAVAVVFFAHGVLLSTWVSRIPAVQQALHLSTGQLGTALLGIALGAIIGMPLAGAAGLRFGSRATTLGGLIVFMAALPIVAATPNFLTLACALPLIGIGTGVTDVSMNAQAVLVERRHGRSIMSSFHGFWSLGAVTGAAIGGYCAGPHLRLSVEAHFTGIALIMGFVGLTAAWFGMIPTALDEYALESPNSADKPARAFRFALPPAPILALSLIAFSSMLAEGAMGDWGALYLHKSLHADQQLAADGYAVFAFTMAATRFVGDHLTVRFGPAALTRAFGCLTTLGIGLAIGTATIPGALIGYALAGIGTSVIVPLVFSAAGRWPGQQPAVTLATVSSTAYISFLLGPPLIGFVAELIHLRWALVLVAACGALTASLSRYMQTDTRDYSVASATV